MYQTPQADLSAAVRERCQGAPCLLSVPTGGPIAPVSVPSMRQFDPKKLRQSQKTEATWSVALIGRNSSPRNLVGDPGHHTPTAAFAPVPWDPDCVCLYSASALQLARRGRFRSALKDGYRGPVARLLAPCLWPLLPCPGRDPEGVGLQD